MFGIATAIGALGSFTIAAGQSHHAPAPAFKSAEVVSASEVAIPFNSVANGLVFLYVTIGKAGNVEDVVVARELASVNDAATQAVKSWRFSPGTLGGKPAVARLAIAVVFCPPWPYGGQLKLSPLPEEVKGATGPYPSRPPDVTVGTFPPNITIAGGTVVLEAVINPSGDLDYAKVIKDFPGLTAPALRDVNEKWKFKRALMDGQPVRSTMVVAFAFRPPVANNSSP
jgi:hypothetical protein